MVKRLFVLMICLSVFAFAHAQKRTDLKGPKAKNYKPWKHKSEATVVYTSAEEEKVQGPEAKNKRFEPKKEDQEVLVANTNHRRFKDLSGPKAKNYKPGK